MSGKGDAIRERILDAAADCLMDGGFGSDRLLSAIARRAGLSRPTLYKYGGSVEDIRNALLARELTKFLELAAPRMAELTWTADNVTELIVLVVTYARDHPLLTAGRRDIPDQVLTAFTTNAGLAIAAVAEVTEPIIANMIELGAMPDLDARHAIDFLSRIAISLVFTNGLVDLDDEGALRAYLRGAFLMTGSLDPPA